MKRSAMFVIPLTVVLMSVLIAPSLFGQPERRLPFAERWLDLTPEQKAKLEELRKAGQEEMKGMFEQTRKLRLELRDLMNDPAANEKKIESVIDELSRLQAARMKSGLKHRAEMNKILTPEQREKLKDLGPRIGRFMHGGRMMPGPMMRRGFRPGWRHAFGPDSGPLGRPFFPRWRW